MWELRSLLGGGRPLEARDGVQDCSWVPQPAPQSLSPSFCRSDYSRGVFCYGDTKGNVFVFTSDNVTNGLFNPQIFPKASKWGS